MGESIKLNLGSGPNELVGYENIDRLKGQEVYPLEYDDSSVDEIRASHVLEHFSHGDVFGVVSHWVSKLAPGGCLKIAVPDLLKICKEYVAGAPINVQGYMYGGQIDENDFHAVGFDKELLKEIFVEAGLERIGIWGDEAKDCHKLDISLNLMGFKPATDSTTIEDRIHAVLGAPRVGFVPHFRCIIESMHRLHIPTKIMTGCFWHKNICKTMEQELKDGADFILTLDYDTIFTAQEILELYRLMKACPDVDAVTSVQSKRQDDKPLFGIGEEHSFRGKKGGVSMDVFNRNLTPITTGHFGLTMFRASSLDSFSRPWMNDSPDEDGTWEDGCTDSDISFWVKWKEEGKNLMLANKVVVGHIEEMITWPSKDKFKPIQQYISDYSRNGIPKEVAR